MTVPVKLWETLRAATTARIGLGHCDGAMPTNALLDFQRCHALARDAVHQPVDVEAVAQGLAYVDPIVVSSRAATRAEYLTRPDLGRRLLVSDREKLQGKRGDIALVLADGLSSSAINQHGVGLAQRLLELLSDLSFAPPVIARQARVALGDEIGAALGAAIVIVVIGERPGLSAADSLGAYITWHPAIGMADSERNCVSNIRPGGLPLDRGARNIAWLVRASLMRKLSGVRLKDGFADDGNTGVLPYNAPMIEPTGEGR